mgnify:CR=1 FL=1|jgi:2-methylisocitrate lyase-like PEP mutase family enzyme
MMIVQEKRIRLKELMASGKCVPAPGVYDAISAKVVEKTGFTVAYLGSYATAASMLGLPDVGAVTMSEMVCHAKNVANNIDIPLVCDAENGFFHAANIWRTVREFESAGACAIHIEDHEFGKHTNLTPIIIDPEKMCKKIQAACAARTDKNFQIFARTDVAWATGDMDDMVKRANMYLEAGANAVFLASGGRIPREIREKIHGPVVVTNGGCSVQEESDSGINLSLYWPMLLYTAFTACKEACDMFLQTKDYSKLGKYVFNEPEFNKYIPFDAFLSRVDQYLD